MLFVVGLGPGHEDYIIKKAESVLKSSDVIIGFKRAVDSLNFIDNKKIYLKSLKDLEKILEENKNFNISLVASGDPMFYGIVNYLNNNITYDFEVVPGISSFQYLASKVKLPWNNAHLGSLHGRNEEFINTVKENNMTVWLTDKENNPSKLCEILYSKSINYNVIIGQNLSYEDEIINIGKPEEFINKQFSELSILIISRE
ncbi:precorrin-6y C5,15-methyltransferase (decarboxylating) subunit CbiE [Clostridium botulinum]|uniref:precorrin-6y C5,15-methyltransferase (decarboxylating) subunit CbiE n=1 Tax=Clostridium TaxID=1485 RepID=UPI000507B5B5|nr:MULTISPECIES: precorrin-6y C5,15-methyltransferase (decarboxylating) subunit CbiE [Clostridium]AIY80433.1 precorrin-6y C5,15-methyltransferase (decarboxylating), CbiE subunit [Clostridium botulinum 202F]KAI3347810.1 precorrin-6y C5,15-methyltransferase (decarboxylating) subunit CbiE [Clostridium botulinum]KFX53986.1 precorrin-6Y-methylase [Clostridium botulinum]KFX57023.1 precorrin-6Y-methylase [Clostridium botulinum]KON14561.1 precorrin-6Y-methylase [Clostridium botulinum]